MGLGIAIDSSKNVYVAGGTFSKLPSQTIVGLEDLAVVKYTRYGDLQWVRQLGVSGEITEAFAIAVDSSSNVYVTGQTCGALDGNVLTGSYNGFLVKYTSAGTKVWTKQLTGQSWGIAIAVDAGDNVYLTGSTETGLDGNSQAGTADLFLIKYNSAGTRQWTQQLGTASKNTDANGVVVNSTSDRIYVVGTTNGGLDGNSLIGTQDTFLIEYDASGFKQWTKQYGVATKNTLADGAAIDGSGNIFIAGSTNGNLQGETLNGAYDGYVMKLDSSGTILWTKLVGVVAATAEANSVTTDSSGNVYFNGSVNAGLDGNTLTGSYDMYLAKYDSSGTKQWVTQNGCPGEITFGIGLQCDRGDGLFSVGYTKCGLNGNTLSGGEDLFVTKHDLNGNLK